MKDLDTMVHDGGPDEIHLHHLRAPESYVTLQVAPRVLVLPTVHAIFGVVDNGKDSSHTSL